MNEEILIICESMYHGNTHKLATAMANELNCIVMNCDQAMSTNIEHYKIIGLGSGIYFTSHHPKLFDIVAKMKSFQKSFLFSTHGRPFLGKYHDQLKVSLFNKNIEVMGEFSCRGYDCTGPYIIVGGGNKGKPNEKDQRRAAHFISNLLPQYCKNTNTTTNGKNIEIRYDECIGCKKCQAVCPMKVFDIKNNKPIVVNESNCIHCNLCKINCPCNAIAIEHSWKEAIKIAKKHAQKTSL